MLSQNELPTEYLNFHKVLAKDSYENFYNSQRIKDFYTSHIRSVNTAVFTDLQFAMKAFISLDSQTQYNAIKYNQTKSLSKNNRVQIPRVADIFLGVTIPCLNLSDIQEVTLFSSGIVNENNDPQEWYNPKAKIVYTPIKTTTHFESNFVSFYDTPVFIASDIFNGLSIEVKYNDNVQNNLLYQHAPVELNFLFVNDSTRRIIQKDYSRYSDFLKA